MHRRRAGRIARPNLGHSEEDDMTVLVAAASKHGATGEIAERIGAELAGQGVDVEVRKLEEVGDLAGYDAFVLGSGVYLGNWLKEARRFVDSHAAELAERPTWLFSSGSIVGDPPADDDPLAVRAKLAERLLEATHAREHKVFAGKLDSNELGFAEKASVRMAHAREGDHRNWRSIDAWAAAIAREVQRGRAEASSAIS
jgi:menaquinone-dependent protoporphyrinogen oxidase